MATYDLRNSAPAVVNEEHLIDRPYRYTWRVDFSEIASGAGLLSTQTALIGDLGPGFVIEDTRAVLRTAEGTSGTIDVGTVSDPDGFLDGGNMNGSANNFVALAGTEVLKNGIYVHTSTSVQITNSGGTTLNGAVVDIMIGGFFTVNS